MRKQCRILLVEDEEQIRTVLGEAIDIEGYDVAVVGTGPEALVRADFTDFDVLITDLSLRGGLDGWAVAERAAASGLGVIFISGDPAQYDRLMNSGHAWLKKPFRLAELISTLQIVLRQIDAQCEPKRAAGGG